MLVGTGIWLPLEMIAFLLFEVKRIGRLITLNLLVDSSAVTMALNEFPAVKKPLKPEAPAMAMLRICSWPSRVEILRPGDAGAFTAPPVVTVFPFWPVAEVP